MRFKLTIFAGGNMGQDCGLTRLIDDNGNSGMAYNSNRSYHCLWCGRIWATWEKEEPATEWPSEWYPYRRSCPDHTFGGWTGDTPGSLILDRKDILVLPRPLLEREFFLLMEKQ